MIDQKCANELYHLEVRQESAVSDCQGTGWFVTVGWKKTRWGNDDPMDEREAVCFGHDHPRYVCKLLYWRDIDESDSSGRQSGGKQTTKYTNLAKMHHFVPITIVTGGAWNELTLEFITELGRTTSGVTQGPRETQFLFQRLSISLQRGNAVAFKNKFSSD